MIREGGFRCLLSVFYFVFGVNEVRRSITKLIARYNETDKMGIIHHSQYVNWFEVGRTEWIKGAGISYRKIEEEGLLMPVLSVQVHYHSPARFEDELAIETALTQYDGVKVGFSYKAVRECDGVLLADGSSEHCWTDFRLKPVSLKKKSPALHEQLMVISEIR